MVALIHFDRLQTCRQTNARHDTFGNLVGLSAALPENHLDIAGVPKDFVPACSHRGKLVPQRRKKSLLEDAVPDSASPKFAHHLRVGGRIGN